MRKPYQASWKKNIKASAPISGLINEQSPDI